MKPIKKRNYECVEEKVKNLVYKRREEKEKEENEEYRRGIWKKH